MLSNAWTFIGRYWPLLLILAGLAKTIEHFTGGSAKLFGWGEVFLVTLIIIFGLAIHKAAPFLDSIPTLIDWDKGQISIRSLFKEPFQIQEEKDISLKAGGLLSVQNGRGNVTIVPVADGQFKIRLNKQVYSETEAEAKKLAEQVQPVVSQEEGRTRITVEQVEDTRSHLEILVPSQCTLQVESNHGDISAEGLEGTNHSFRTSNGRISLSRISGGVTASNQNGKIQVENMTGTTGLSSTHGAIEARNISGDLTVSTAYASVDIFDIKGNVAVTNSHNSVSVIKTTGKVEVIAPQSKVTIEDVQGPVRAEADQREMRITRVASSVDLRQKNGSTSVERIGSELKASLEHSNFTGYDLQGAVQLEAEYSDIRMEKTAGQVNIRNRLRPVSVIDFTSRVQVENEDASIYLSSSEPVQQPVQARTDHGKIEFIQPENSQFRLAASSRTGRVHCDFPQLLPSSADRNLRTINGELGSGGPLITLETTQGSIWIKKK